MRRLVYLASAQSDLVSIVDYITHMSGSAAIGRRFAGDLRAQCARLASLPGTLGRARPELHSDIRSFPYKGYMIFFRYVDDAFEVVNILEGHRDLGTYFDTDS
ncbi:MAG: type II toxin-antitoxin system RelE/ParE family toxin [Propylenella sp.]